MKRVLITVCGRAGSKGFRNKNLKVFCDRPLVYYTLSAAELFCRARPDLQVEVALNTDSPELQALVAQRYPETVLVERPQELCGDTVPKMAVFQQTLAEMERRGGGRYDHLIDLDITSPIRRESDVAGAFAAAEARADQLCDVFGIGGIRDKYPAEISGGEKQRTAVARALINHPLLVLADEPTGNLDSKSARAVIRTFEQARQALGATIFMVTHDSYAASHCDRVVILQDGRVRRTLEKGGMERSAFQDLLLDAIREMGKE